MKNETQRRRKGRRRSRKKLWINDRWFGLIVDEHFPVMFSFAVVFHFTDLFFIKICFFPFFFFYLFHSHSLNKWNSKRWKREEKKMNERNENSLNFYPCQFIFFPWISISFVVHERTIIAAADDFFLKFHNNFFFLTKQHLAYEPLSFEIHLQMCRLFALSVYSFPFSSYPVFQFFLETLSLSLFWLYFFLFHKLIFLCISALCRRHFI